MRYLVQEDLLERCDGVDGREQCLEELGFGGRHELA
jgi:hypothetical protein